MARKALLFICLLGGAGVLAAPPTADAPENNDVSIFMETTSRIVGGEIAPENSVPWKVALTTGTLIRSFFCGGSIISERHVLTAAHCIDAVYNRWTGLSYSLRGRYGTQRWNSGGALISFSGNVTHQNYLAGVIKNDIGVLITSGVMLLSETAKIVPLRFDPVDAGLQAQVAGYGTDRAGGSVQANLKVNILPVISEEECVLLRDWMVATGGWRNVPQIEYHIEICTFLDIGQGTCNGDSGSALTTLDTQEVIGVVSWGFPCAVGGPDMFARLSAFKEFVEDALLR